MTIEKNMKIKLLIYALISASAFSYLCMPGNAGISVPLFIIIEFLCLFFIIPNKKRLFLFIPIFIISLNSFISASDVWKTPNFFVITALFIALFTEFDLKKDSLAFFAKITEGVILPFAFLSLPYKWLTEIKGNSSPILKRVLIGIAAAIPCTIILTVALSGADAVFSIKTGNMLTSIFETLNFHTIYIILCGILAGGFLFGTACRSFYNAPTPDECKKSATGDIIIINIILFAVLFVYTLFVIIQFKYLFAGAALPDGLSYTNYARKGFFELLALTGINIAVILTVVKLTKNHTGKWGILTKIFCHYLTFVTVILLISSFYRMHLYTNSDGLTRLRFFVMIFLIFEAVGLIVTFIYVAKPQFNIFLVYTIIALSCYTVLNILPSDNIIAKNQINLYLNNNRTDLDYIFTLSLDAAPAMKNLYSNTDDPELKSRILCFMSENTTDNIPKRWQRYNLSKENAKH